MTKLQCIPFDNLDYMFAMEFREYLTHLFVFKNCYHDISYTPTFYSANWYYNDLWHFVQFIVKGPWAKVARRYRTLLPLAGVGNTQPGEEKTLCHIFSEDLFCKQLLWTLPCSVLQCIGEKKKSNYSYLPYSLVFPYSSSAIALSRIRRSVTLEPKYIWPSWHLRTL